MESFAEETIESVIASSEREASSQITEGARAIAKKLGHAESGAFESAFEGIQPTQQGAEMLIRDTMSNPHRILRGSNVIDVYNSDDQGIRIQNATNKFIGFLEGILARP